MRAKPCFFAGGERRLAPAFGDHYRIAWRFVAKFVKISTCRRKMLNVNKKFIIFMLKSLDKRPKSGYIIYAIVSTPSLQVLKYTKTQGKEVTLLGGSKAHTQKNADIEGCG